MLSKNNKKFFVDFLNSQKNTVRFYFYMFYLNQEVLYLKTLFLFLGRILINNS